MFLKKFFNRITGNYPPESLGLDWLVAALSLWFVGGVFVDGWAHNHLDSALETFFTPWHALLYTGFGAVAIAVGVVWFRNMRRGFSWNRALPRGYNLSAVGALIFLGGGIGDVGWHTLFGVEANVDALLSPTHLLLALGGALLVGGPLRSAVAHSVGAWHAMPVRRQLPMVFSLIFFKAFLGFMTQYAHPITHPWMGINHKPADVFFGQAMGVANVLVQAAIIMGALVWTLRRRLLPIGSFTLLFFIHAVGFAVFKDEYRFVLPLFGAGVVVDVMYAALRGAIHKFPLPSRWFHAFAFLVPFIYYLVYFLTILATEGLWWSVHLAAGTIFIAGLVGWMMSFLVSATRE